MSLYSQELPLEQLKDRKRNAIELSMQLPFDLPLHDSKLLREWNYKRLHDQEHGSSLLFLHLESYKIFDLVVSDFYILPFGRPLEEDEYYFITNGNLLNQGLLTGRSTK